MTTATQTEPTDELTDDLFSAAFDEGLVDASSAEKKVEPVVAEPVSVVEPAVEPVAVVEPVVEPVVAPVVATQPIDIQSIIAATIAATKPVEAVKVAPVVAAQTPEEIAAEEQYKKDWPDQYAREQRLLGQVENLKTLLNTTVQTLQGQIAPVVEASQLNSRERFEADVTKVHADAFTNIPKVEEWIAKQPAFLQPHYNAVLDSGSAKATIELLDLFKASTAAPVVPPPATDELAAARLKRMEVPTTVRTSVTAEPDANDFDDAFDRGAAQLKL